MDSPSVMVKRMMERIRARTQQELAASPAAKLSFGTATEAAGPRSSLSGGGEAMAGASLAASRLGGRTDGSGSRSESIMREAYLATLEREKDKLAAATGKAGAAANTAGDSVRVLNGSGLSLGATSYASRSPSLAAELTSEAARTSGALQKTILNLSTTLDSTAAQYEAKLDEQEAAFESELRASAAREARSQHAVQMTTVKANESVAALEAALAEKDAMISYLQRSALESTDGSAAAASEIARLEAALAQTKATLESERAFHQDRSLTHTQTIAALREKLAAAEAAAGSKATDAAALRSQLEADLAQTVEKLTAERKEALFAEQKAASAERELRLQLSEAQAQAQRAVDARDALHAKYDAALENIDKLKDETAELRAAANDERAAWNVARDELEAEWRKNNASVTALLQEERSRASGASKRVSLLEASLAALQNEYDALKDAHAAALAARAQAEQDVTSAAEAGRAALSAAVAEEAARGEAALEKAVREAEARVAQAQVDAEAKLTALREEHNAYVAELRNDAAREADDYEAALADERERLAAAELRFAEQLDGMQSQISDILASYSADEADRASTKMALRDKVAKLQAANKELALVLEHTKQANSVLESQLVSAKEASRATSAKLAAAYATIDELRGNIETLIQDHHGQLNSLVSSQQAKLEAYRRSLADSLPSPLARQPEPTPLPPSPVHAATPDRGSSAPAPLGASADNNVAAIKAAIATKNARASEIDAAFARVVRGFEEEASKDTEATSARDNIVAEVSQRVSSMFDTFLATQAAGTSAGAGADADADVSSSDESEYEHEHDTDASTSVQAQIGMLQSKMSQLQSQLPQSPKKSRSSRRGDESHGSHGARQGRHNERQPVRQRVRRRSRSSSQTDKPSRTEGRGGHPRHGRERGRGRERDRTPGYLSGTAASRGKSRDGSRNVRHAWK
ncbi:uncharacterized protein AMSG_01731 [Thecamonas trahens ATCC 50062]|uniref:Uncharacterized protein n=1 Tax=Thecamonas trahens ATCC 50062 TaxID=461836 RepID=A0A0L0DTB8_THETB|nr:hypothetical protein AMSG_01731 [Thecamonas trahens ATCC 50062]KNC55467.1 hypothetical protein AMSG_01731 [Thecamonas trahens ATCC 50062]|eukprot:XP_013761247.1 hypothetical protein AMSG_01731 [Thecamonas trahens ATCC 50062]